MYDNFLKLPAAKQTGELLLKRRGKYFKSITVDEGESFELFLRIPRIIGSLSATLSIFKDGEKLCAYKSNFSWSGFELDKDIFTAKIKKDQLKCGLYFIEITIKTDIGTLYAARTNGNIYFTEVSSSVQLTVSLFKYDKPTRIYGGIIYHAFVDRFCRGNGAIPKDGNRIIVGEWKKIAEYPEYPGAPLKNDTFYGGNLDGVREKLPYLSSLGVSIIYLSPIFEARSNHKYDTADYMSVDSCFGGDEALKNLIDESKKYGIEIILDGVFNHTGDDSIYFNRYGKYDSLGAYQSKDSEYYSWYDFSCYPDDYNSWWGIKILPRIHPDKPECGNYFLKKGGVIDKYRKMGIYGMRLDVADELSDKFIAGIKEKLSEEGESYLIGEVWEDGSNKISYDVRKSYYQGNELDGVMNYPLRQGIIDFLTEKKTDSLRYALTDVIDNAPKRIVDSLMNLLGTHDTERILNILSGVKYNGLSNKELSMKKLTEYEKAKGIKRLFLAYTALATLPGVPSIYYGDEVGLEGFKDPFNRMPYPYGKENTKILDFYKKIGIIRRGNSVYEDGEFKLLHLSEDILVFSRSKAWNTMVTIINNADKDLFIESDNEITSILDGRNSIFHIIHGMTPAIISVKCGTKLKIHRG